MLQDLSSSKIASLIAEGSYSCLYLISAFSVLFDASEIFSEVIGYTARISELLIAMGFTPAQARSLSWTKFGECKDGTVICSDEHSQAERKGDGWSLLMADAAFCCHQWLFARAGRYDAVRNSESDDAAFGNDFEEHPSRPLLHHSLTNPVEDDSSPTSALVAGTAHERPGFTDLFTGFVGDGLHSPAAAHSYPAETVLAVQSLTVRNPDRKVNPFRD